MSYSCSSHQLHLNRASKCQSFVAASVKSDFYAFHEDCIGNAVFELFRNKKFVSLFDVDESVLLLLRVNYSSATKNCHPKMVEGAEVCRD